MFSLSGSSNLTVFFTAGLVAVPPTLEVAPERARVVFGGSGADFSGSGATTFFGLPRVALTGAAASALDASVASFFAGRPRVGFAVAVVVVVEAAAAVCREDWPEPASFRGRPLVVLRVAVTSPWANSSSSSESSALALRLAAVLFVLAVGVDLALAAAVTILVVLTAGSLALAAALARVLRFGGDSIVGDFYFF